MSSNEPNTVAMHEFGEFSSEYLGWLHHEKVDYIIKQEVI